MVVEEVQKEQEQEMEVLVVELLLVFQILEVVVIHLLLVHLKVMTVVMDLQVVNTEVLVGVELPLLDPLLQDQLLLVPAELEHQTIF